MQFTLAECFERCAGVQFARAECFVHCYLEFSLSFFLDSQQTWFICRLQKKNLFKRISLKKVPFSIAGKGFEPHDLRVMSPTSYQTALPRDIRFINRRCRTPGSNRYDTFVSRDFKSRASANSATPAHTSRTGLFPCCLYSIPQLHRFVKVFRKNIFNSVKVFPILFDRCVFNSPLPTTTVVFAAFIPITSPQKTGQKRSPARGKSHNSTWAAPQPA